MIHSYLNPQQAGRILGISSDTAARYFDQGKLAGHRLPGGHRRISRESVLRLFGERDEVDKVLLVTDRRDLVCLFESGGMPLIAVDKWVEVRPAIIYHKPEAVICDMAMGREHAIHAAMHLHMEPKRPTLLAICYEDGPGGGLWDAVLQWPFEVPALLAVLCKLATVKT